LVLATIFVLCHIEYIRRKKDGGWMDNIPIVEPKKIPFKCPVCNGFGTVKFGQLVCQACDGKGYVVVNQEGEKDGRMDKNT
jgi:RecJ-like exonuclease